MTRFRCTPIPEATATRWRQTGQDDRGNALIRRLVDGPGFPCRHCLRLGQVGEAMLLGSYDLPFPLGVYWTPSPIFLHAEAADCPRFEAADAIAPTVLANGLVSVRAYDADGLCLYDLGQVTEGADVAAPLARALDDPRTHRVNIHTARPGCLLTAVERLPAA
ncbi:DUF1203 domain-containing protein [Falsiroseomonas selenitidurans]|uniref:DUF1203 domain-containing protein n=1 Tax=Falsiroseomonas selenitidurans TaxID=2716335 RepID=A0ABX1DY45_9PROT|nr:DUF1203 domain-containing protein [Falsiroseomonas selenitidurans]NKC29793.1 DUF1203 domain-containing protein [Falsiroseomonas selenitidurans]